MGGQALVFKALDKENYDNPVVIKTLRDDGLDDWARKKFEQEKEALAKLQDLNGVVKLINKAKTDSGKEFTVMEFLPGVELAMLLNDLPGNLQRAARLFRRIASTMGEAHKRGVYHRDLKSLNIMVVHPGDFNEMPKIIDFGIARLEQSALTGATTKNAVGTPFYLSPNALRNQPETKADDIYALGMLAYEMVTGGYPISLENIAWPEILEVQKNIARYSPSNKNKMLSKAVDAEILKALSEDPKNRHSSAQEFGDNLYHALMAIGVAGETVVIPPSPTTKSFAAGKIIGAILLIPLLILLAVLAWRNFFTPVDVAQVPHPQNSNANTVILSNSNGNNRAENTNRPSSTPENRQDTMDPNKFSVGLLKRTKENKPVYALIDEVFRAGDGVRFNIAPMENGFMQIYLRENNGKIEKIYDGQVKALVDFSTPANQWMFFDDKPGVETIFFVFSINRRETIDVISLEAEGNGKTLFSTRNNLAVMIMKLNHVK